MATPPPPRRPTRSSKALRKQLAKAQVEAGLPHRRRLPSERTAVTHKFDIAGHEGYITVGLYPDGQPGEIFLKMAKEGSTVSGLMDAFATTVSVSLQYGVPLRDLVNKFAHVRFEPSGFTGNQEIPIAKSLVDYIFRWLGSRFLSPEEKVTLGLQPAAEGGEPPAVRLRCRCRRLPGLLPGRGRRFGARSRGRPGAGPGRRTRDSPRATAVADGPAPVHEELAVIATNGHALDAAANGGSAKPANGNGGGGTSTITLNLGATKVSFQTQADAPGCSDCGSIMVRNGSCYKCLNCGSTSGCS